ncbi:MAG: hypothetical protein H6719_31960 [Sandaracinaceae bacterium]|nr:hypothetical protein [Sandaracinaceae bacterium]
MTSYLVGVRYSARVDNIDPGGIIGRGRGATREEAETLALDDAELRLALSHSRQALGAASRALRGDRPDED